jgi:hypothetical protein
VVRNSVLLGFKVVTTINTRPLSHRAMKHLIFMLSVTLLFSTIADDAHAYFVKMMAMRVALMWILHLIHILDVPVLLDICRMLLHLPFAILFTVLAFRIDNDDHPLALLTILFLGFDWCHSMMGARKFL